MFKFLASKDFDGEVFSLGRIWKIVLKNKQIIVIWSHVWAQEAIGLQELNAIVWDTTARKVGILTLTERNLIIFCRAVIFVTEHYYYFDIFLQLIYINIAIWVINFTKLIKINFSCGIRVSVIGLFKFEIWHERWVGHVDFAFFAVKLKIRLRLRNVILWPTNHIFIELPQIPRGRQHKEDRNNASAYAPMNLAEALFIELFVTAGKECLDVCAKDV